MSYNSNQSTIIIDIFISYDNINLIIGVISRAEKIGLGKYILLWLFKQID